MITRHAFTGAAIFIAAFAFTGSMAAASPSAQVSREPSVSCRWNKKTTFTAILEDLAAQAHVTFVAEGKPFQAALDRSLSDRFPQGTGPVETVVAEVAARFDYDAERRGSVFYLTKRYTLPYDLPSVTLGECRQSLSDVIRAASRLNPKLRPKTIFESPGVDSVIRSLSEQQVKDLPSGLSVSQLSIESREALGKMGMHSYVQEPISTLEKVQRQLENINQTDAHLILVTSNGRTFLQYQHPDGTSDLVPQPAMFSKRSPALEASEVLNAPNSSSEDTIAAQIRALNQLVPAGDKQYAEEEYLGGKSAVVVGRENSPPQETAAALARVYGLRLMAEPNAEPREKQLRLTRPRAALVTDVKDLPASVTRLLPFPLIRIVRGEERLISAILVSPELDANGFPPLPFSMRRMEFGKKVRNAAILQMEKSVIPLLQAKPDKQISLAEVSSEAKDLLAMILMLNNWEVLWRLTNPEQPRYVTNPDSVYLQGGEKLDKVTGKVNGFSVFITYKNAEGKFPVEFAVIRYYPQVSP